MMQPLQKQTIMMVMIGACTVHDTFLYEVRDAPIHTLLQVVALKISVANLHAEFDDTGRCVPVYVPFGSLLQCQVGQQKHN
jgi:hypothetical protein